MTEESNRRSRFPIPRKFPQAFIKRKRHDLFYTSLVGISTSKTEPELELKRAAVVERIGDLSEIG